MIVVVAIRHPPEDNEAVQDETVSEISGAVVSTGGVGGVGAVVVAVLVAACGKLVVAELVVVTVEVTGVTDGGGVGDVLPSTMPMPPLLPPLSFPSPIAVGDKLLRESRKDTAAGGA